MDISSLPNLPNPRTCRDLLP